MIQVQVKDSLPPQTRAPGRRGAETAMNGFTNGNSQVTSHHFGHSKAVADDYYIKPLPAETRIAALGLDSALAETIRRLNVGLHRA